MWFAKYLPCFSKRSESSLSALPSCQNCARKRWLLNTEGLLAAGGIYLGTHAALEGQSEWVKKACTAGALCICFLNSIILHAPSSEPSSWGSMLTGGILSGAGIGWCLTAAFGKQPKSTIVAYMAGVISICVANSIMFYVPTYERIQVVSKSVSLKTGSNSKPKVIMHHHTCRDSRGRPIPRTAKDLVNISKNLQSGGKQCHKCHRFFDEMISEPSDGIKQPEESNEKEVETQSVTDGKLKIPYERKNIIEEKFSNNYAEIDENRKCQENNVKLSVNNKSIVQSEQSNVATSGSPTGNVSESLESHQQIEMQNELTFPAELNFPLNSNETKFAGNKKSASNDSPRLTVASRFLADETVSP